MVAPACHRSGRAIPCRRPVKPVSSNTFGLLIAYILPGALVLWGLSFVSQTIRTWLGTSPSESPTVGGFLYVTLASVGAGLTVSTVRWMVLDSINHRTGIPRPQWDFSRLQKNIAAFDRIVEDQYRYFQFYGNTFVSIIVVYVARRAGIGYSQTLADWMDALLLALACVFFLGSRDTYRKYVLRGNMLLGRTAPPQRGAQVEPRPASEEPPDAKAADAAKSVRGH